MKRARAPAALALGLILALAPAGCRIEVEDETSSGSDLQMYSERMLKESAAAWNEGELDVFMDDYLESENTTFIGSAGFLVGFDSIRERYAHRFEPGAPRDSLRFESIRARRLGAIYGLVTARFVLHQADSITASGPFTLVLRRVSNAWRIIHDHSSSDPPAEDSAPAASDSASTPVE
jgi:ketosteroid isomerase-like protein